MGLRELIRRGKFAIDANILIYTIERQSIHFNFLENFWQACEAEDVTVHTSALSLMECLILPLRSVNVQLQVRYEEYFKSRNLLLVEITDDVLRRAAALRGQFRSLRTPDAIHLATAIKMGCHRFLTHDARLRSIEGLDVIQLTDLAKDR